MVGLLTIRYGPLENPHWQRRIVRGGWGNHAWLCFSFLIDEKVEQHATKPKYKTLGIVCSLAQETTAIHLESIHHSPKTLLTPQQTHLCFRVQTQQALFALAKTGDSYSNGSRSLSSSAFVALLVSNSFGCLFPALKSSEKCQLIPEQ